MLPITRFWRAILLAALPWAISGLGCAGHRVPAIDPSGEHIFSGASTAIVSPIAECPLFHRTAPLVPPAAVQPVPVLPAVPAATCPQPLAVVAQPIPVAPPPICAPPNQVPMTPLSPATVGPPPCRGAPPEPILKVTPGLIVAPVCSEVILAAGLCGPDGYLITGQPLEWMIPPDSVGQIVQVGRETHTGFTSYFRGSPHKVGTNYVRAYTSSIAQTIDRGTPNPLDDVSLAKGQSWISVTSPTEGTTHVTVWAPHEKDWERRRTTARIYWVDAKWSFPAPQISRSGQPVRLTTRITRASGAPVAGWLVRYDVVDGPEASFGARREKSIEVQAQADGSATVELVPNTTTPGITQVRIQIVRPATGRGDLPQMVVGQGLTSVTWSSPGLQVSAAGPETVPVNGTLTYRVEVVNNGDLVARDVKLSFVPPRSISFLSSTPQGSPLGQTLVWRLGDLRPHSATVVQVNCRATMVADVRAVFRAESADKLASEGSVSTRVFASALSIHMTGPETAEVGQTAQFRVELTNTSRTPMTNVLVRDTYDPGLAEVQGKRSPLEFTLDQIAPGETKQFAVTFTVKEPGKQCHRIDVSAEGGHAASARGCVTGVTASAAPPAAGTPPASSAKLSLEIKSVSQIEVGKSGIVQVDVVNNSATPITNLQLVVEHGGSLNPTQASPDATPEDSSVVWQIASLGPRQRVSRQVEYEGVQADPRAIVRAKVTSDQTAEQTKEAVVRIVTPAITPPAAGGKGSPPMGSKTGPMGGKAGPMGKAAPPATNANNLKVNAADNPDPVKAGGEVTYLIDLTNVGMEADSDIVLTFTLPTGFTKVSFSRSARPLQVQSLSGGRYELPLSDPIGAGEKFGPITLKATATKAGKASLKVTIKSALNPRGFDVTVETTVLPGP